MERSLAHTRWMCKYHIVFTPKYRRKIIYNKLRRDIVQIIKDLRIVLVKIFTCKKSSTRVHF